MRKKAWILCTAMVVALAGCSNVSDNNTTDIIQVSSETMTTTEAATEPPKMKLRPNLLRRAIPRTAHYSQKVRIQGRRNPLRQKLRRRNPSHRKASHPMIRGRKSSRRRCMRSMVWCRIITNISEMMSIRSM